MRVELEENSEERSLALRRAERRIMDAQDRVSKRRKEELSARRESARLHCETGFMEFRSFYQAHGRLAAARASRETLVAQRRLIKRRIRATKLLLQAHHDELEGVATETMLVDRSLSAMMTEMSAVGWLSTPPPPRKSTAAPPSRWPQQPWFDDTESERSSGSDMDILDRGDSSAADHQFV